MPESGGLPPALSRIQADMVVVAAGAEKRRPRPACHDVEPQHPAVKRDRAIEIGDLQVNVANINSRIDALAHNS